MKKLLTSSLIAALSLGWGLATSPAPAPAFTVVPSGKLDGGTYADWGIVWWIWALTTPEDRDPVVDLTGKHCAVNQEDDVWFLAGAYENGTAVKRACDIPADTTLFFPVVNVRSLGDTRAECEASLPAASSMASARGVQVKVDGKVTSGVQRGRTDHCVYLEGADVWMGVDGHWMALKFNTPGRHTVAFTADWDGFKQNVTYTLNVAASRLQPSIEY